MSKSKIFTYRYESFGGILHLKKPSALVWVDKDYMRNLGYPDSPLWDTKSEILSAPTEVHATITRQCNAGCESCYVDSYKPDSRPELFKKELGLEGNKKLIDMLADVRVFHLALGGGESLEMPWFFDLADYAAEKKIIPNLTTNGFLIDENNVHRCKIFGQINVSIDGLEEDYAQTRGVPGFSDADRALTLLKKSGCRFGINTVVSSKNFEHIEDIVRYAKQKGVNQIELLRYKPAGRAVDHFYEMDMTSKQAMEFFPMVKHLTRKYRVNLRLDCSLMPMVFAHNPDPKRVNMFSVAGCLGGDWLMGVCPDGKVNACSFSPVENWNVFDLKEKWSASDSFSLFRKWHYNPKPPCDACEFLSDCRGGCHVVAALVLNDPGKPDPGCPIVRKYYDSMQ